MAGLTLLWLVRSRLPALLRRLPLPLVFVALYGAAHVLSAGLATEHRGLAFKFALRMIVMAGFAVVVAAAPPEAHRRGLVALTAGACLVALLAVLEVGGVRALDSFLNLFREAPFNVAGSRRGSAGSEYPNLAAGFLMYGLLSGVGLMAPLPRAAVAVVPLVAWLSLGLLCTYSRGALVASTVGCAAMAFALSRRERRLARAPVAALAVLGASAAAFAWGGEVFRLRFGSEGTERWYAAAYAPAETALVLRPAEVRRTEVRVTNTGQKTWARDEAFRLSYHWLDEEKRRSVDGMRTDLPRDILPGESAVLHAEVRAPDTEGRYLLVWDMVHEETTWFTGQGVRPAVVPSVVSRAGAEPALAPPAAAAFEGPLAWRPGRGELWRLAAQMWHERLLTGVGSDNFRWLYGPKAGRALWDTRVFANNTLLEAAATTGALGLLALLGLLVSAILFAARRLLSLPASGMGAGAALLGLSVALAAHGVVDYVLAFTGHYLLFGFVAGAITALGHGDMPS